MKAIAQTQYGDVSVLQEVDVPKPVASGRDIVVKVSAVSVNPVDFKKRSNFGNVTAALDNAPLIVGYDASGVVDSVGPDAQLFNAGDEVWFSGSLIRNGTNGEFALVDERIVGRKPGSIDHGAAAALPLTVLTAWEGMFEGAHIPLRALPLTSADEPTGAEKVMLVIGGAGGAGSIAIQLARSVAAVPLRVIATASREETKKFCLDQGAHAVINHRGDLKAELEALGVSGVDYVFNTASTEEYWPRLLPVLNPLATVININGTAGPLDMGPGMVKRINFVWELMFTRPIFGVELERQNAILNAAADLVDAGVIRTTETLRRKFSLDELRAAHLAQEAGTMIGKQVLVRE